jgi:lysine 6-dehydrogenase
MRYAVIGSGRQGTAAAYDMARFGRADEVRLLDSDEIAAHRAAERINQLVKRPVATWGRVDVRDESALAASLEGIDAALSGVPYFFNVGAAKAAIRAGCHFNDLGGNTDVVLAELALDQDARAAGVSVVPDCGLAPGMSNNLAAWGIGLFDKPLHVRMWCGGLPQNPRPPLGYRQVFSLEGLTNEYTGEAVVLRNGRRVSVPAFTEREELDVDGIGRLEAFYTSGGTSTCPWTYEGKLETYEYKTLRYPGHFAMIRPLIELGLLEKEPIPVGNVQVSPRAVVHAVLAPRISFPGDPDLVVLRVEVSGAKGGREKRLRIDILDREDPDTGFTAMERTTAFPASIVSLLQAGGKVDPGARPLEVAVPAEEFMTELRRRNIPMKETWIEP